MQLIGEAILLVVLGSINTTKVRLTRDVAAAPVDSTPSPSPDASAQRFLISNHRYSTPRPIDSSSGWFHNTLAVYSRIQPRVTRDAKPDDGNGLDQEKISIESRKRSKTAMNLSKKTGSVMRSAEIESDGMHSFQAIYS